MTARTAAAGPAAPRAAVSADRPPRFSQELVASPWAARTAVPAALVVAALAGLSVTVGWGVPLVVVLVVALLVAAWQRPVVAAVAAAAVVPALAGLGRGSLVPGLKASEALLVLAALVVFLRGPARWRPVGGVDLALGVFALAGLGFATLHAARGVPLDVDEFARVALLPTFLALTWWTASRAVADTGDVVVVLRWVLLVSIVPAVVGLAQYADLPGVRDAIVTVVGDGVMPVAGEETARVTGPFPIAHSFGGYLLFPIVLAVVLLLRSDRTVLRRPLLLLVLAVDLAAAVLAVTLTLLLWIVVAVAVAALLAGRLTRAAALAVVVAAASVLLFSDALENRFEQQTTAASGTGGGLVPQTLQYRILIWQRDYLPLVGRSWPIGVGVDQPEGVVFGSTENQYVTLVLRGGVGLLLAAAIAVAAVGVRAWRRARAADDGAQGAAERSAALAVLGILVFLPAAAMVWPYLTNAGFPQTLFGVAGAALAVAGGPWRRSPVPVFGPGAPGWVYAPSAAGTSGASSGTEASRMP